MRTNTKEKERFLAIARDSGKIIKVKWNKRRQWAWYYTLGARTLAMIKSCLEREVDYTFQVDFDIVIRYIAILIKR